MTIALCFAAGIAGGLVVLLLCKRGPRGERGYNGPPGMNGRDA